MFLGPKPEISTGKCPSVDQSGQLPVCRQAGSKVSWRNIAISLIDLVAGDLAGEPAIQVIEAGLTFARCCQALCMVERLTW